MICTKKSGNVQMILTMTEEEAEELSGLLAMASWDELSWAYPLYEALGTATDTMFSWNEDEQVLTPTQPDEI